MFTENPFLVLGLWGSTWPQIAKPSVVCQLPCASKDRNVRAAGVHGHLLRLRHGVVGLGKDNRPRYRRAHSGGSLYRVTRPFLTLSMQPTVFSLAIERIDGAATMVQEPDEETPGFESKK